jgi:hypothetical protein
MKRLLAIFSPGRPRPRRRAWPPRLGCYRGESLEARLLLNSMPMIDLGVQVGTTQALTEISGIAVSRSLTDSLWVHQDSGDTARFYGLNTSGVFHSTITLSGAPAVDWEDMTIAAKPGGGNYLYFADIGDNSSNRTAGVDIIRVTEPTVAGNATLTSTDYKIKRVVYPTGPKNAESLFVDPQTGDFYIITKQGLSGLYRLPAAQFDVAGTYTLESLGNINAPLGSPTAADISPDGKFIIVRNSAGTTAYIFERDPGQTVAAAIQNTPTAVTLRAEPQGESIGWTPDGTALYSISEGTSRPVWKYTFDTLHTNVSAGGPYSLVMGGSLALSAAATGLGPLSYTWDVNDDGIFGDATGPNPTLTWSELDALGLDELPAARDVMVKVDNGAHPPVAASTTLNVTSGSNSTVTGRRTFYNNSIWDNPTFGFNNASAVAPDKSAYLPLGSPGTVTVGIQNVTNYTKGINGIMVEISGVSNATAADFTVEMSGQNLAADNTPSGWTAAPAFTVTAVPNTPSVGTRRYELVWPDGSIVDRYISVTTKANGNTNLAAPDTFYFGNRVGDAFTNYSGFFNTDATDALEIRGNQSPFALITNPYDFDRDAVVDASDELAARNDQNFMPALVLSNPPAAPLAAGDSESSERAAVASALSRAAADLAIAGWPSNDDLVDAVLPGHRNPKRQRGFFGGV